MYQALHGLLTTTPYSSKSLMFRATTLALFVRTTEAIIRSTVAVGRPA